MLRNYFKIAWRHLQKSRVSSFINISGLAVGMAVAMLTGLWLHDELSFNRYHEHYDRIARIATRGISKDGVSVNVPQSYALISELKDHYSDRFQYLVRSTDMGESILSSGENKVSRIGQYMDEDAPFLFSLKMIRGSRAALREPYSILLSASTAGRGTGLLIGWVRADALGVGTSSTQPAGNAQNKKPPHIGRGSL